MRRCLVTLMLLGCSAATALSPRDAALSPPRDVPADAATPVRDAGPSMPDAAGPTRDPHDAGDPRPRPPRGASWHIDLEAPVDTDVRADWFDVDLFDNGAEVMRAIHARGARVVCYFSAGSGEDWRPDYASFPATALGSPLDGWAGERWLDVRRDGVRAVMRARLDRARAQGCDGVDPDNVDGYDNANGLGLTASDQLAYNRWLADEAHARGLVVGLKNDVAQIPALLEHFDFAVNEQCFAFAECDAVAAFTRAGRAVLSIEYGDVVANAGAYCPRAASLGFFTILSARDRLDGRYTRCAP
ncbi:MAG: endo alpha-1,4 polygalactosaminidase [Polyangiales bacterium]